MPKVNLDELIKAGTLNEDDVLNYAKKLEPGVDVLNACATRMHTLFCHSKVHDPKPENINYQSPNVCYWYAEEVLDSKWEALTHKHWKQRCETQMTYLNMTNPIDFLKFLVVISKTVGDMEDLILLHPSAKGMFRELLI